MVAGISAEPALVVDDADGVRTITINRPEVKNALTAAMRTRLCELLDAADGDAATRAVILTAVDPVFSAGVERWGDFTALNRDPADPTGTTMAVFSSYAYDPSPPSSTTFLWDEWIGLITDT